MKALILHSEDWEGLFVNGRLIDEGHSLGEGKGKLPHLKELSKEYGFSLYGIEEKEVTEEDDEYLYKFGSFPLDLSELKGRY